MRHALLATALLLSACVPTEDLEADYCANSHGGVRCTFDDECCPNHKCLPAPGVENRCYEMGRCIRSTDAGGFAFATGIACSCNSDCASSKCTNSVCE